MQTGVLGYGQETRDKELCGVGVELLPAGVHSGVHPVPNHCWSPLFVFLAQLAEAPLLRAASHWPE